MELERAKLIPLFYLEQWDQGLLSSKGNRSKVEYYFTLTPSFLLYLLENVRDLEHITYLDSDIVFFSNPKPIFNFLGDGSILIVGHRFPERLKHLEIYGIYNVGLLTFKGDSEGKRCLEWWRERCIEWCFDIAMDGRFADQKYLDDWPDRFKGVVVLDHPGAGLAPWNQSQYRKRIRNGKVIVDGRPILFYHFQGLRRINRWFYDLGMANYGRPSIILRNFVYIPTIREMVLLERKISPIINQLGKVEGNGDPRGRSGYRGRSILKRLILNDIAISIGRWVF
jgi:hypothetical protein